MGERAVVRSLQLSLWATSSEPTIHQPHTLIFFVLALVGLGVAAASIWNKRDTASQRRVFWAGVFGAAVCGFIASLPNWKMGLAMFLFLFVGMCIPAYFSTPFIKLGGKVWAFHIQDSESEANQIRRRGIGAGPEEWSSDPHPDSYGTGVTAAKAWWLMIVTYTIGMVNIVFAIADRKLDWVTAIAVVGLVLLSVGLAYGDASWGYRVARGQYVQFAIIGIMTAGVFAVLYLLAFAAGRRWPLRRQQSLEYRAHPRHQKKDP